MLQYPAQSEPGERPLLIDRSKKTTNSKEDMKMRKTGLKIRCPEIRKENKK
jgi:hypothetical protein